MAKQQKQNIIHLGCGAVKVPGAIGVDINPASQADVIHDLNQFPYPFRTGQFNRIVVTNTIEHLDDIVSVIEELHRIAKPGALVQITTGHFSGIDSFTDPTHKHFFTSRSFDYFIPGTDLYRYQYSSVKFKKRLVVAGPVNTTNIALRLLLRFLNRHLLYYEKRFAFIFPVGVIYYELEVIK